MLSVHIMSISGAHFLDLNIMTGHKSSTSTHPGPSHRHFIQLKIVYDTPPRIKNCRKGHPEPRKKSYMLIDYRCSDRIRGYSIRVHVGVLR